MAEHHAVLEAEANPSPVDVFRLTADFNREVIGLPLPVEPTRLDPLRKEWTCTALGEELIEFHDAENLADEIDALEDLIYFAAGRLYEMGVDGGRHFLAVHGPNMKKQRGELSKRPNSRGFDAVKPDGWVGPDHDAILNRAMWDTGRRPKVILLGHARHGKDTVAELLRDRYGFKFQSSSMFCAEKIMMPYFQQFGLMGDYVLNDDRRFKAYLTVEECYADRVRFRDVWYDQISAYNQPDAARLCRELFEVNDVYVGMRAADEFTASSPLADIVVWVDRSDHLPPEDESSCTVESSMADIILDNNGTLEDLSRAVDELIFNMIGIKA